MVSGEFGLTLTVMVFLKHLKECLLHQVIPQLGNSNIYIPTAAAGAYTGNLTTRMRVVLNEYSPINACGTYSYGETEDYAVKLIDLSACSTAPPSGIMVNNLTPSYS
jgi:hypothetical protein